MKRLTSAIALCASLLLAQSVASAAPIVDQNNPTVAGGFCPVALEFHCGQSFFQTADYISGAGVHIHPGWFAASADLTIGLFDAAVGGTRLAAGKASNVDHKSGWVDVFWDPVALASNTQYYLLLSSTSTELVPAYSQYGAYANGNALYRGSIYAGYDLTFRTYAGSVADVPEPASLALLGMGMLGLAATRRKLARR